MEEIDILRVEHVNDITTIHELRTCLEDEKRDLMEEMKFNNAQEKEEIKKEVKRLEKEKNDIKKQMETQRKDSNMTEKKKESLEGRLEERDLLVGRLEEEVLKYKKELNTMKNEERKVNEENGKMATRNGVSFEKKGKHSGVTVSDKQIQTELTYEEQLQEATRKIILDMTRDNVISNQHDVTHRNTQTSPRRSMGEPSNFDNITDTSDTDDPTMIDDSVLTGNESVRAPSKNVKTTGDKEVVAESGNRSSVVGTPSKKSRMKTKSPIHREWKSMRQRVLSLAQQVAALKVSKESLTKSTNEQQSANEKLQNDLIQCQQRLKLSKQTVERLTKDLEECSKQKQALAKTSKDYKIPSYPTEKHLEDRLKLSSNECSRLSYELKCARKTNEELQEKLKSCQERNTRQEHLLNQKKSFVEEMRSRLKVAQENLESTAHELKQAEEKIRRMTEKENQRKNQIDSLKRQLELEVKNRQAFERLHEKNQEDLKRKAKLLSRAQTLRQEAETAVNEMEEAANAQLHNLANQSQVTLSAIEGRLIKSKQRIEEFKMVVITLTERLIEQFVNSKMARKQETSRRLDEQKQKPSMQQACELASSILNMSKTDIDELLDVDVFEDEQSFHCSDEGEWKKKVEETLAKESFATPLVQILLEMIQGIVELEKRNAEEHPTIS